MLSNLKKYVLQFREIYFTTCHLPAVLQVDNMVFSLIAKCISSVTCQLQIDNIVFSLFAKCISLALTGPKLGAKETEAS